MRESLGGLPSVVWIHVEVVAYDDLETAGVEGFAAPEETNVTGLAEGIERTAGEEAPGYEFVDAAFGGGEGGGRYEGNRVDGRVGLVVVRAVAGLGEATVHQSR